MAHSRQARPVEREKAVDATRDNERAPEEAKGHIEAPLAIQPVNGNAIAPIVRAVIKSIAWYAFTTLIVIFVYGAIAMGIFSALMLIKRLTSTP